MRMNDDKYIDEVLTRMRRLDTKTVNVNTRPIKLGRADITPVIRQYYQPPVKQQTGVHLLSIHKPAFSRINRSD